LEDPGVDKSVILKFI